MVFRPNSNNLPGFSSSSLLISFIFVTRLPDNVLTLQGEFTSRFSVKFNLDRTWRPWAFVLNWDRPIASQVFSVNKIILVMLPVASDF